MSRGGRAPHLRAGSLAAALLTSACGIDQPPSPTTPVPPELPEASIAYMRITGDEYPGAVVVRNLDDGSERVLTDAGYPVAMTLDNDAIFVAEPLDDPQQRLMLYSTDGDAPLELLDAVFMNYAYPTSSPDGRYVALASDGAVPHGLVILDLESGTATQLTADGASGTPRWSSDGRWIAYQAISPRTGSFDVYAVEVGGGEPRALTTTLATELPLGWSDDSAAVVVERQSDLAVPGEDVFLVDVISGAVTAADPQPSSALSAVSPDGGWQLRSVMDGTELRPVGTGGAPRLLTNSVRAHVTWSPDGRWLVWSGRASDEDDAQPDLFALRLPDGEPIPVTDSALHEVMPIWGTPSTYPPEETAP